MTEAALMHMQPHMQKKAAAMHVPIVYTAEQLFYALSSVMLWHCTCMLLYYKFAIAHPILY